MESAFLHISREEELSETVRSFPALKDKSHKSFKGKDAAKNTWDGIATVLEFTQPVTILFIWYNPLVPGVTNLYPQYH